MISPLTNRNDSGIITKLISALPISTNGGVTQLVEYPVHTRSVTCSSQVAATRPVGQAVKTPPFHGGNMGSIPVRVTKKDRHTSVCLSFLFLRRESNPSKSNSPVGSDASAASGGKSELSEWQRSADEEGVLSPTKMPGTATGSVACRQLDGGNSLISPKAKCKSIPVRVCK